MSIYKSKIFADFFNHWILYVWPLFFKVMANIRNQYIFIYDHFLLVSGLFLDFVGGVLLKKDIYSKNYSQTWFICLPIRYCCTVGDFGTLELLDKFGPQKQHTGLTHWSEESKNSGHDWLTQHSGIPTLMTTSTWHLCELKVWQ